MKPRRTRTLPLLALSCLFCCPIAAACGGPRLATLAPGLYGEAGEAGSAGVGQSGASALEAGMGGAATTTDAGAGG